MSGKWGRKSVILFYASVRGLLTMKRQEYGRSPSVAVIDDDYRD